MSRNVAGHNTGDTINTTPKAAQLLIDQGYAEAIDSKPTRKASTKTESKSDDKPAE